MNIRDYIEKTSSSKRQLRLAKKYLGEQAAAKADRILIVRKQMPPLSPVGSREMKKTLKLGSIARAVEKKHLHGRGAARAYAMGDIKTGDMMKAYGQAEEHRRQNLMRGLKRSKYDSLQSKARKAFGKIKK